MVPLEPPLRRAYFAGFAVAVGFRWFALSALCGLCLLARKLHLRGTGGTLVTALLWMSALSAIYLIPFLSGFLAAFFWRPIRWRSEQHAQINAVAGSALLAWLPVFALTVGLVLPVMLLDIWFCGQGSKRGLVFWNGCLGRQFLGDFSTRDDE